MINTLMVLLLKYSGGFVLFFYSDSTGEESLWIVSRATKVPQSWLLAPDIGQHGKEGLAHFLGSKGIWKLHGGSQWHKGSCVQWYFTRKAQPIPRQLWSCQLWHSLQSWVATRCWHVQFWTLNNKKSNLPGMLSLAKIADAPNEKAHHTSGT